MPMINKTITFGAEIEAVKLVESYREVISRNHFSTHYDRTIRDRDGGELPGNIESGGGAEVVTQPLSCAVTAQPDGNNMVLNFGESEARIRALCEMVTEVNKSCGFHVHLGRPESDTDNHSKWEPEKVRTFMIIGANLEEKLFGLCPSSRRNNQYCKTIRESYSVSDLRQFYPMGQVNPRKYDNPKRYCWLNTIETRRSGTNEAGARGPGLGTIEIRMLGNVRRHEYIWAWIKLWCKIAALVAYVPSSLAIQHCCYTDTLAGDFRAIEQVKSSAERKPAI